MIFRLAAKSLANRKHSVMLTLLSLIVSISVLISVEHIRHQAKESFNRTLSGTDLIVGARSGQLNLLLYTVFRIGAPTTNISWRAVEQLERNKLVKWVVPISLGDSHRGYRVLGTTPPYFEHYKYGNKQPLELRNGEVFSSPFGAVVGYDVAKTLNYQVGDIISIAHGLGQVSFTNHDQAPFTITGILAPTGTPVDKTIHIPLAGLDAVHMPPSALANFLEAGKSGQYPKLTPDSVTSALIGLKSKFATFKLQRNINTDKKEPMTAILPGVALAELWQVLGGVENVLRVIALLILVSSLLGLSTMLLASMRERKAELAVLRAIGAGPSTIFLLIELEALMLTIIAIASSFGLVSGLLWLSSDWLIENYGVFISASVFTPTLGIAAAIVLGLSALVAAMPAIGAYRTTLQSGLTVR